MNALETLPEFIKIKEVTHMRLDKTSEEYTTRGWSLPIEYVDESLKIRDFMKHLNGVELIPISREEFVKKQGEF